MGGVFGNFLDLQVVVLVLFGEGFKEECRFAQSRFAQCRSPCFVWRRIQRGETMLVLNRRATVVVLVLFGEGFKASGGGYDKANTKVVVLVLFGEGFKETIKT